MPFSRTLKLAISTLVKHLLALLFLQRFRRSAQHTIFERSEKCSGFIDTTTVNFTNLKCRHSNPGEKRTGLKISVLMQEAMNLES